MANINFMDSPFLTAGTANQTLPNAINLSTSLGVLVANGSTITSTTSSINTAGYVLTANASGVPTFQANPGSSLSSATVWTSSNETATYPSSVNIGALSPGLLKYTISSGIATPAVAVPATTSAANDYQPGSRLLSSFAASAPSLLEMWVSTGANSVTTIPACPAAGYVLTGSTTIPPGWAPLPGIVQDLGQISMVSMGDLLVASGVGNSFNNLAINTNAGYVLTSNGTYPGWAPLQGALPSVGGLSMVRGSLILGGSTATTVSQLSPGTSGYVLTSAGTGADPTWSAPASLGSTLTSIQGLTIASQDLLVGSGTNTMTKLTKGSNGTYLTVSGGNVAWNALPGALPTVGALTIASQDILVGNGANSMTNLAKGSNGQFLTVASGNVGWAALPGSLPGIGALSIVQGDLVVGDTTAGTVTRLPKGTSGYVLTAGASTISWQAATGLPTIPSGAGPYKLTTWQGAAAWACRKPYFTRAIDSANDSTWPTPSSASNYYKTFVDDEPTYLYSLGSSNIGFNFAGVETGMTGFNATTTGQKIFFSIYFISGWSTSTTGDQIPALGWANSATTSTQGSVANWYSPHSGGKNGWGMALGTGTTAYNWRDNVANASFTVTGGVANFNGLIMSMGYDTTAGSITVWLHTASTGAQVATGSYTLNGSSSLLTQTNLVPFFCPGTGTTGTSTATKFQILSTGYPTLSGYTYFYDR